MFNKSAATIALVLLGACANQPTKTSEAVATSEKPVRSQRANQATTTTFGTLGGAFVSAGTINEVPTITATSPNPPKGSTAMYNLRVPGGVDRGRLETVVAKALLEKGYTPRIASNSDLQLDVNVDASPSEMGITVVLRTPRDGELYWTANRGMRFTGDTSSIQMPGQQIPPQTRAWNEGKTDRAVELLTAILRELPRQTDAAK